MYGRFCGGVSCKVRRLDDVSRLPWLPQVSLLEDTPSRKVPVSRTFAGPAADILAVALSEAAPGSTPSLAAATYVGLAFDCRAVAALDAAAADA